MSDERTYKMLLADIAGGGSGGGGLPDYSEANDGDVLSIDNGEPSWASPASGLPDYSGASDGDVLTVKEGTEEIAVVPEETVTIDDAPVPFANVDISGLSDGSEVTVIVNGNSYNAVITGVDPSSLALGWGIEAFVSVDLSYFVEDQEGTGTAYFSAYDGNVSIVPGEYTVSVVASVPSGDLTPQWAAPSGGVPFYSLAEGNDAWALVDMEGNTPTYNDILFKPVAVSSDAGILSMGLCAMYTVDDSPVYSFGVAFASALSVGGSPVALFTTANATSENGDDPIDNITVQNYTGEVTEL